jgi:hypothetical protein
MSHALHPLLQVMIAPLFLAVLISPGVVEGDDRDRTRTLLRRDLRCCVC